MADQDCATRQTIGIDLRVPRSRIHAQASQEAIASVESRTAGAGIAAAGAP